MGKMIAVCGSPDSGKTTASLKLAKEIYSMQKTSVIYVSPDLSVPSLGYIFPNAKSDELYSVGIALNKTDIYKEDVEKQYVNVKTMSNFAFLAYKTGENKFSYPEPTEDKVVQFLNSIKECAEYVIVDCTCDDEIISRIAKRDCDIAIQIVNADIKSMVYYSSCANHFVSIMRKKIIVLNITDNDLYLPIDEVKAHFGGIKFTLPYSRDLKQQTITGTLSEEIHDKKYRSEIRKIAEAVI